LEINVWVGYVVPVGPVASKKMYAKSERLRLIMKGQGFHLARNLIILGHWQSSTSLEILPSLSSKMIKVNRNL
jgi:hypothetical protein